MPPSSAPEEQVQTVVVGRFDRDDTDMSPSAQPCMNSGDEQPSWWGPQGTDADFASVLLSAPPSRSVEENPSENTWYLTGKDIDISPWQDISLTPGAGPSGETSGIPEAHRPITEQSFEIIKIKEFHDEKIYPNEFKYESEVNEIVEFCKNKAFDAEYKNTLQGKVVPPEYRGKFYKVNKIYEKYLSDTHKNIVNIAVGMLNNVLEYQYEAENNSLLKSYINIINDILSNKNIPMKQLSKNAGFYDNYYGRLFTKEGVLKGSPAFRKDLESNIERCMQWNDVMRKYKIHENIIKHPNLPPQ